LQDDFAAVTAIDINTSGFAGIFLLSVCLTHPDATTITFVPVQTIGLKTGTGNSLTAPSASVETRAYDALGRLIHTELGTKQDDFEYDSRGRTTKHRVQYLAIGASADYSTLYSYNYAGQPTSTTDGNGHTTSWDYTPAGWLNSETKPDPDGTGPNFSPQTTYG
jgi:YD repeat-containing protein